jgi:hypothetical protein
MRVAVTGLLVSAALGMWPAMARAVETGRLVEKDGTYVFVESQDPAIKLLMERALKQGVITKEEYERAVRESEERARLLQPSFRAWCDS